MTSSSRLLRALDSTDKEIESTSVNGPYVHYCAAQNVTSVSGHNANCHAPYKAQSSFQPAFQQFIIKGTTSSSPAADRTPCIGREATLLSLSASHCSMSDALLTDSNSHFLTEYNRYTASEVSRCTEDTDVYTDIISFHSYPQSRVSMGNRESTVTKSVRGTPCNSVAVSNMSNSVQNSSSTVSLANGREIQQQQQRDIVSASCSSNAPWGAGETRCGAIHQADTCGTVPLRHISLSVPPTSPAVRLNQSSVASVRASQSSLSLLPASQVAQSECPNLQIGFSECNAPLVETAPQIPVSSIATQAYQSASCCTQSDTGNFRKNVIGRCYQLPVTTEDTSSDTASTSVSAAWTDCVPVVNTVTSVMSVIDSPSQHTVKVKVGGYTPVTGEADRPYVAGRRYTVTKDDGQKVEGVWDGKYLAVAAESNNSPTQTQTATKCITSSCTASSSASTLDVDIFTASKRHVTQTMPDCHVKLDKLDPSSMYGCKRMKVQPSISRKSFYGARVNDGPCHNARRPHRQRKNLEVDLHASNVIHIDDDDDSNDDDSVILSQSDDNRSHDESCVSTGGGGRWNLVEDDDCEGSIPVDCIEFGDLTQTARRAIFKEHTLTIELDNNNTASQLTLEGCDMKSIHCQAVSGDNSHLQVVITVSKSYKTQLFNFLGTDADVNELVINVSKPIDELKQLKQLVCRLGVLGPDNEDDSYSVDSSLDMECQEVNTSSSYCPLSYSKTSPPVHHVERRKPLHPTTASPSLTPRLPAHGTQQSLQSAFQRQKHTAAKVDSLARPCLQNSSALQALHAYDDQEQSREEDDARTQSTDNEEVIVSLPFNSRIIKLFTYPAPPAVGGITVTNEDLFCLNDGEFLNDVVIEFYIKYLYNEVLASSQREKTHIFNTFFYGQLTKENKDSSSGLSLQQRRHSQVKRWTKHVDIFSKDFIIVPINEDSHWFLAIICFPHLVGSDVSAGCLVSSQKLTNAKKITSTDDIPTENKNPCILIFDSLKNGANRWNIAVILREYLQVEWDLKKAPTQGAKLFDKPTMKGATPGCPQQSNSSDCGIYVLHYIESFFKHPLHDFSLPIRYLTEWFPKREVHRKRCEIRRLILSLTHRLNPSLNYNPKQDGCDVDD